jgi:hypothetical protein
MTLPFDECRNRIIRREDPTMVQIEVNRRNLDRVLTAEERALWWRLKADTSQAEMAS